jgi:hypothetical protein
VRLRLLLHALGIVVSVLFGKRMPGPPALEQPQQIAQSHLIQYDAHPHPPVHGGTGRGAALDGHGREGDPGIPLRAGRLAPRQESSEGRSTTPRKLSAGQRRVQPSLDISDAIREKGTSTDSAMR